MQGVQGGPWIGSHKPTEGWELAQFPSRVGTDPWISLASSRLIYLRSQTAGSYSKLAVEPPQQVDLGLAYFA
jgi:hypothetical protein